ncbi:ABC transporter substrate-binding protein [Phaeospirillum tilakii]|uniref:ABC transporter substrate-binding protein n=1 Tax=Phaeospirillum tilakii TaxID=741673 RepID=A0ABW5C6N1_9PROT
MRLGVLLTLTLLLALPALAEPPRRIVSANLCADRLVLELAERDRVRAVGPFAADPAVSTVAAAAQGLPVTEGRVEQILAFHPDLVVLGTFNDPATGMLLERLGVPVYRVGAPQSLDGVRAEIRRLAAALGETARGEAMVARLEAGLAALPRLERPVVAAVYQAGGWSAGRGTLADELFGRVGLVNLAAATGRSGIAPLPLETLVAGRPELIVIESMGEEAPSLSGELLRHPVLAGRGLRRVTVPMRLWACPDPALAAAAALVAEAAR